MASDHHNYPDYYKIKLETELTIPDQGSTGAMSKAQRDKGLHAEREIIDRHKAINIHAERYPLSGANRFRGSGHDVDLYPFGRDAAPLVAEVKARKNGSGFTQLKKWLGEYQVLFLRQNRADPLVVLPWSTWAALLEKARR
jgi:hypothetical protein